jgi:membrane-bound ClpP family serine protease
MASWKDIVRSIAPTLGTALGGPMAGAATKFIADKMLGKEDASQEEIQEAIISASPEQLVKLREIDNQFKLQMRNLQIDVYELEYKDRDSARKLFEVNILPQITLSALFVLGYFGVLYFLMNSGIDETSMINNPVFTTILGVLTAAIPQILGFWFGSSLGSKQKTESMNRAAHKNSSMDS